MRLGILHLFIGFLVIFHEGWALNTPPEISVSNEWTLSENDPVGTYVTWVRIHDADNDPVKVSIGRPSSHFGGTTSSHIKGQSFFKINEAGRVKLAKSLQGMAGERFLVGILANDGHLQHRIDVQVRVLGANESPIYSPISLTSSFDPGPPPPSPDSIKNPALSGGGPPLLHLDHLTIWKVPSNAEVGSVVAHVDAQDLGNSFLVYSIDSDSLLDIDEKTGIVTIGSSLAGKEGDHGIKVTASNKYHPITERVTLRVLNSDGSAVSYEGKSPKKKHKHKLRPELSAKEIPNITIIGKDDESEDDNDDDEDNDIDDEGPTKSRRMLGWSVASIVILILVIVVIGLLSLFLYRWFQKRNKLRAAAKESSVSFSGKKVENHRGSIVDDIFSIVGIRKRAESNGYEHDLKIPKVPSRRLNDSIKSNISNNEMQIDKWEFPRHKLKILDILGEGCFGQVWKCDATGLIEEGTSLVAVKTLKKSAGKSEKNDLLQELKVLKSLGYHPNVVSLIGCCTEKDPIFVILEYMIGGKLQSYLRGSRASRSYDNLHGVSASLTPRDLTIFALQVAKGMNFLAKNGIIHRDLAARNILIGENKICKVADFGFARDIANNYVYERKSDGILPIRWMAPESLIDNIFTAKSDVWSFGVLLWEIVTLGCTPYPGMSAAEVMSRIKDGYRMEKPGHCGREIYNMMYYCWDDDQERRPSFTELVQILEALIMTEVEYIHLDNFPDHTYYNLSSGL